LNNQAENVSNPAHNLAPCPVMVYSSEISAIGEDPGKGEIKWNRIVLHSAGASHP